MARHAIERLAVLHIIAQLGCERIFGILLILHAATSWYPQTGTDNFSAHRRIRDFPNQAPMHAARRHFELRNLLNVSTGRSTLPHNQHLCKFISTTYLKFIAEMPPQDTPAASSPWKVG